MSALAKYCTVCGCEDPPLTGQRVRTCLAPGCLLFERPTDERMGDTAADGVNPDPRCRDTRALPALRNSTTAFELLPPLGLTEALRKARSAADACGVPVRLRVEFTVDSGHGWVVEDWVEPAQTAWKRDYR